MRNVLAWIGGWMRRVAERLQQQRTQSEPGRIAPLRQADRRAALGFRRTATVAAEHAVPRRQQESVVAIGFLAALGMMDAMHRRNHHPGAQLGEASGRERKGQSEETMVGDVKLKKKQTK